MQFGFLGEKGKVSKRMWDSACLLLMTGNHRYRTSLRLTPSGGSLKFSLLMGQPHYVAKNLIESFKLFLSSKVVLYPGRKSMAKK